MKEIDTTTALDSVFANNDKCILKIGTECCGPCKLVNGFLEELEKIHTDITFIKIDADNYQGDDYIERFNVRNIPVVVFIRKGNVLGKSVGMQTRQQLEDKISTLFV